MVMCISFRMRVASAVLILAALILHPVDGASRGWGRRWGSAHITFYGSPGGYGTEGGACGYQNTFALGYGVMTAALSAPLFKKGAACGACFKLKCARIRETPIAKNWCYSYTRTITITATNHCPSGSEGAWCNPPRHHFDLPMPAFANLAKLEGGVVPVHYSRVHCLKRGGIRFTMGGNQWFLMILIHNVGGAGDVRAVKIKSPSTRWIPMYRNWGAVWTVRINLAGALSFMITSGDGRVLVTRNAVGPWWRFGQTFEAHTNFW